MKTLVIDTATKACSVALFDGTLVLASFHEVIGRGHAERLLPLVAALPDRGRADRIFVDVGPGSFTGIRVGVAAAKALGFAWTVPVHGYGCLTLVAAMARDKLASPASVDVVMAGGHGEYFFAPFDANGAALSAPFSATSDQIAAASQADYVAGDSDLALADRQWIDTIPNASKWPLVQLLQPLPPSPVYGRAPDAKPPKGFVA